MSSIPPARSLAKLARRSMSFLDALIDRFLSSGWPSYAAVALLQLKIIWGIWRFRDLTTGDTSAYFTMALRWTNSFAVNIVWSPLYTAYYGTLHSLTGDLYAATILHRAAIVMAATLGVLAIMRRVLPAGLALLVAVWWAILPINFETLYEVHLFALLPILAIWMTIASGDTACTRGIALAGLLAATVLVRNELIVASGIFALICLWRELTRLRHGSKPAAHAWQSIIACYALPVVLAATVCAFFYWRSDYKYPEIAEISRGKHTLNMCQVYAFGYSQRHPDWTLSPWTECHGLMETIFGRPEPTIVQMIQANPQAALKHFLWNLSLTPNGFQVALFNSMSGTVNPDYAPVNRSQTAFILTIAALLLVTAAGVAVARRWRYWWLEWFRERKGTWLIFLAVACVVAPVIVTQRPRPSYLFSTTVVLMAMIGTAAHVVTWRWPRAQNRCALAGLTVALGAAPSYYVHHQSERPLYKNVQILQPLVPSIRNIRNRILFGDYNGELALYLGLTRVVAATFDYSILAGRKEDQPLDQFLQERDINVVYVQPRIIPELRAAPRGSDLLDRPESVGWRRLWPERQVNSLTLLLYRDRAGETP